MKLVPFRKREGFSDLENIQNEVNRLFNTSLSRWFDEDKSLLEGVWNPAVDIQESKDNIVISADLPGVKKDEIEISVHGDILVIKGEKKHEKEEKDKNYVRTERTYGSFTRSFTLPAEVDSAKIDAAYNDGVLKLTLPKKEELKPKQIKVDIK